MIVAPVNGGFPPIIDSLYTCNEVRKKNNQLWIRGLDLKKKKKKNTGVSAKNREFEKKFLN